MRYPWLILLFFLLSPFAVLAQSASITGVITGGDSKKPLARASVFLSNSAAGTITSDNGSYGLYSVRPGQYTMVVSILGYEQYSKSILVGNEPIKLDIQLAQKPLVLREVVISTAADFKKNFEEFKKQFIGTDENAKYCEILNPHILSLVYNQTKQVLSANTDQFLIIENKALGYRIKYLLDTFYTDHINQVTSAHGSQVFEDLPGSEAQKKKWHEKREEAYHGSSMHFFRSLYQNKLDQEGFMMYHLSRSLNPIRPPDNEIRSRIAQYVNHHMIDSANYMVTLARMSKWYHESLSKTALNGYDILMNGEQPGLFGIHFTNYLYIVYTKKTDDTPDINIYRPITQANYAVSILTIYSPYAQFDKNGILVGGDTLTEGTWASQRMSDRLPVDYVPDAN
jgi:CarboxypepD_reg-like domain